VKFSIALGKRGGEEKKRKTISLPVKFGIALGKGGAI